MRKLIAVILIFLSVSCYADELSRKLVTAAVERTNHSVTYDGRYFNISYPNGDIPDNLGVCTDVVIRSYRKLGIDLQQRVHEDKKDNILSPVETQCQWRRDIEFLDVDCFFEVFELALFGGRKAAGKGAA